MYKRKRDIILWSNFTDHVIFQLLEVMSSGSDLPLLTFGANMYLTFT